MNFFKLYIGDYQRDTAHLSVVEHGAFLLMLQHYYATEKPLPLDIRAICRLIRADSKQDREATEKVLAEFWTETSEGYVNNRAMREILKADTQRTINRELGKRGGRPRKTESDIEQQTEQKTESVSEIEPNDNPNQTPDTRHKNQDLLSDSPSANADLAACREILTFLNRMTGRKYRDVDANIRLVRGILRKTPIAEVKRTLAYMGDKWRDDPKMYPYLRPATLFAAKNFESYYAEAMANAD